MTDRKYTIRPGAADSTPEWDASPEFAATLAEAKRKRTLIARGMGLPSSAIEIVKTPVPDKPFLTPQMEADWWAKYG